MFPGPASAELFMTLLSGKSFLVSGIQIFLVFTSGRINIMFLFLTAGAPETGDWLVSCFQFQENLISLKSGKVWENLRIGFYCKGFVESLQADSFSSFSGLTHNWGYVQTGLPYFDKGPSFKFQCFSKTMERTTEIMLSSRTLLVHSVLSTNKTSPLRSVNSVICQSPKRDHTTTGKAFCLTSTRHAPVYTCVICFF